MHLPALGPLPGHLSPSSQLLAGLHSSDILPRWVRLVITTRTDFAHRFLRFQPLVVSLGGWLGSCWFEFLFCFSTFFPTPPPFSAPTAQTEEARMWDRLWDRAFVMKPSEI